MGKKAMRVMLDTNVLVSAFIFHGKHIQKLIDILTEYHTIVLSSYILHELKEVIKEKFLSKYTDLDKFLTNLPFELVYAPDTLDSKKYPAMRDLDDLPVLATAIIEGVDILLTGDKDFEGLALEIPEILTPAQFIAKYHDGIRKRECIKG
ncbi:MAG: putative toxin-antitoxin system toxin component, PIN family [Desulfovibrio sp.]|nr:putative toxin-antitoxin system toxin component, PIN family [Desulfovibrio sp.]